LDRTAWQDLEHTWRRDNQLVRTTCYLLKRQGHHITAAANISEALEAAGTGRFDLVISELCRVIAAACPA
jgi:DNA-binding NtrC family response regulator